MLIIKELINNKKYIDIIRKLKEKVISLEATSVHVKK